MFAGVAVFLLEESNGMVAPVSSRVEVVRCVIAIIEAETVALHKNVILYKFISFLKTRGCVWMDGV